jgi:hypothetical protein
MAFDIEEYIKERRKKETSNTAANTANKEDFDVEEYIKRRKVPEVAETISSRINNWLTSSNDYFKSSSNRYSTRDNSVYGLEDSIGWKETVTSQKDWFNKEAENINKLLSSYEKYFDKDWVANVRNTLNSTLRNQEAVVNYADGDIKYWSQWDNEDAYHNDYFGNKYSGKTYADIQEAMGATEGKEKAWLSINADNYMSSAEAQAEIDRLSKVKKPSMFGGISSTSTETAQYKVAQDRIAKLTTIKNKAELKEKNSEFLKEAEEDPAYIGYVGRGEKRGSLLTEFRNDPIKALADSAKMMKGGGMDSDEQKYARHMTDDEYQTYLFFLGKYGESKANEYLGTIEESINAREAGRIAKTIDTPLEYVFFGAKAGIDQFASGMKSLFSGEDYIPASPVQMASGIVRENLSDTGPKLPEWLGGGSLGQVGYDAITTTTNMLPSIFASVASNAVVPGSGAFVGTGLLGASAAGHGKAEMLNLGYSKGQATAYGLMVGAAEGGLQYLLGGITSLGGNSSGLTKWALSKVDNALARVAITVGSGMISEGFEEGLQTAIEPWLKEIATGVDWESPEIDEILYSSLLGAISSLGFEGIGSVRGEVQYSNALKNTGKDILTTNGGYDALKNLATEVSSEGLVKNEANIGKLVEKTQTGVDAINNKTASGHQQNKTYKQIGKLSESVESVRNEQNLAEIQSSLEGKGLSKTDAKRAAQLLNEALYTDGAYSKELYKSVMKDEGVWDTLRELVSSPDSTLKSRNLKHKLGRLGLKVGEGGTIVSSVKAEEAENKYVDESLSFVEDASQRKYTASAEGKSIVNSTGDAIDIVEVASIKDGQMMLKVKDADGVESVVNARDVSYASESEALIYEAVANMGLNAVSANSIIKSYNPTQDAGVFARGMQEAYRYGRYNYSEYEMYQEGNFLHDLTEEQIQKAYKLGQIQSGSDTAVAVAKLKEAIANSKGKKGEGKVHFKGDAVNIDVESLKDQQKVSLKTMEMLSKALGIEFYVYSSYVNAKGERVYKDANGEVKPAPNGKYERATGAIHIDLNAGEKGEGTMLYTVAHELTHFIKAWSPAKFKVLANFLVEQYGKKGVSVEELVRRQMEHMKASGRKNVTYDLAFEEFVADSMETMLTSGNVMETLAELKRRDEGLWNKIKEFFSNLVDLLKKTVKAYEGYGPDTIEGQTVAEMTDVIEQFEKLFSEGLADASENFRSISSAEQQTLAEVGIRYSSRETLSEASEKLETIADEEYLKEKQATPFVLVMEHTPKAILDSMEGSNDRKILIRRDALYLAIREDGIQEGHYHGLGKEVLSKLPEYLEHPDVILSTIDPETKTENNSRRLVLTHIPAKNGQAIVSIEFESIKDFEGKNDYFNMIITVFDLHENYLKRQFKKFGAKVKYQKEDLAQVNPQLFEWLRTINAKSSNGSISHPSDSVKDFDENPHSDRNKDSVLKEMHSISDRINELRRARTELESSKEYNTLIEKSVLSDTEEERNAGLNEFKAWAEKHKYKEIVEEMDSLLKKYSDLNKTYEELRSQEATAEEQKKIEASGLSEADYFRKSAVKEFGYTPYFYDAGYLLPNGKMLNFSGEKGNHFGSRGQDHRAIGIVYANVSGGKAMLKFMSEGNIRVMAETPGLDISSDVEPTSEQYSVIKRFARESAKEKYFMVDITDKDGNVIGTYSYENNINADRVVNDIKYYFANGTMRASSIVADFHYSLRNKDSVSNRSLLANALESAVTNEFERKTLNDYKEELGRADALEKELGEIRSKIRELSFAKGPKDTEALKKLREQEVKTVNRIDIRDKKLLRLEATKPLKDIIHRERDKAYKRAEKEGKEALAKYREKTAETQRELLNRWQESRHKAVEGRNKTAMRHKIRGIVSELNNLLLHGTKDKHIMIGLQKAVASALDAVNMDTVGAEERVAKYNALIAKEKNPDVIESLTATRDRILAQGDKLGEKLANLKNAYSEIKNSDDPLIANSYDEVIFSKIEAVVTSVGDTALRDMSLSQLEDVYDLYKMVLTTIRNSNKAFKAKKGEEISVLGNRVMEEVETVGGKKQQRLKALEGIKQYGWNILKPVYAFKLIGSKTFSEVFDNVRAGEDTWARDIDEAQAFRTATFKKYNYKSWDFNKKYKFTSKAGVSFDLTLEQMLSLYAYSKRKQADDHLEKGGFVFDTAIEVTEKKHGIPLKYNVNTATAHNLSKETLAQIIGNLSTEQKGFVDEMQDYLSTVMGEKGNEVSLEMYGVKLFKEKFYFPLKSARQFMFEQNEVAGEVKIKNSGFSKETVAHANNPIILDNFMDVWANHVNDMSMYHSFVLALEDFNRVFNYKTPTADNMPTESVKMYLQNAYGTEAASYIKQLLTDLNGGARSDPQAGIINKAIGKFKKAKVFASMSVVVQQPSALGRAFAYVDPKYFVGKKVNKNEQMKTWNEVKKYAPIAIIKEMGYFDVGNGRSTVNYLKGDKSIMDRVDDVASWLPAKADELTWCTIWEAVKRETADKNKALKVGSEEFLKVAGERFTEVIVNTQVYDSVLSRSGMMRSKDTGVKMATAFMAEPTTAMNMMVDAHLQTKRGDKKSARRIRGGVITSVLINSILVAFVYASRDDDEDETYAEKYLGSLTSEVIDGFNPLTYLPIVKDIWSIAQGFDVERSDMSMFADLIESGKKLFSKNESTLDKVMNFTGDVSSIFGLPVKNIMRDVKALFNVANGIIEGTQTTSAGIGYSVMDAIRNTTPVWGWIDSGPSKSQKLYNALASGDQVQIDRLKGGYKDEEAYENAVKKAIRDNDKDVKKMVKAFASGNFSSVKSVLEAVASRYGISESLADEIIDAEYNYYKGKITDAAKALKEGKTSEYKDIVKTLRERYRGVYSQDDIVNAVKGKSLEPTEESSKIEDAESVYETWQINSALENGDTDTATAIVDDLVRVKTENYLAKAKAEAEKNGKKFNENTALKEAESKARSSVKSSITSHWKPLYKEAYKNKDSEEMLRIRQLLLATGVYGRTSELLDTVTGWLKD